MIRFEITGAEEVRQRLRQVAPDVHGNIEQSIGRLCLKLMRTVKSPKLSGGVLGVQTGRLRRSINMRMTGAGSNRVEGFVGTNVEYGRRHELGFTGNETVKAHLRTITQAWGKPIAARQVQVNSFTRQTNTPERSFLRSTLKEMDAEIMASLKSAVKRGIKR